MNVEIFIIATNSSIVNNYIKSNKFQNNKIVGISIFFGTETSERFLSFQIAGIFILCSIRRVLRLGLQL